MVRGGTPASQSWKTFLRNHAQAIAAIDLCVVPVLTLDGALIAIENDAYRDLSGCVFPFVRSGNARGSSA